MECTPTAYRLQAQASDVARNHGCLFNNFPQRSRNDSLACCTASKEPCQQVVSRSWLFVSDFVQRIANAGLQGIEKLLIIDPQAGKAIRHLITFGSVVVDSGTGMTCFIGWTGPKRSTAIPSAAGDNAKQVLKCS